MTIRYRPEIDGLRTVAVGSVLIYHLDLEVFGKKVFEGGFLGVDIFFVISGFLIASLIQKEVATTGRFSLVDFYERRARRLLPALFAMLAVSYAVALYMLVPTAMEEFARSALASVAFVSNIFWLIQNNTYGAPSGLIQPLLHTWSLAVEEQFYLVFPLLYVAALLRVRRGLFWIGLGVVVAGFILAHVLTRNDFSFSFYMIFSRIWELLSGALLAHLLATKPGVGQNLPFAGALPAIGLLMIGYSLVDIPLRWHHPGLGTAGAVLGTLLVIAFARKGEIVTWLLSTRLFVGVGLISYSLYLWHYPIYAFGRLRALMEPGAADYAAWIVLSVLAATLTYYVVEQPFRNRSRITRPVLTGALAACTVAVAALSVSVLVRDGMPGRMERLAALYGPVEPDNQRLLQQSWSVLDEIAIRNGIAPAGSQAAQTPSEFERDHLWFDLDRPGRKVLIIGNSHAKDLFNALHLNREKFPQYQFARFGMGNTFRDDQIDTLLSTPNFRESDTVLLSFRYHPRTMAPVGPLVARLIAEGKQVVMTTNTPEFDRSDTFTIADRYLRRHGALDADRINSIAWENRSMERVSPINETLRGIAATHGVRLLDKLDFVCDRQRQTCANVTPSGRKTLFDYGHYTVAGARHLGARIAELGWLALDDGHPQAPDTAGD